MSLSSTCIIPNPDHHQFLFIREMGRRRICWPEACVGHFSSTFSHGEHKSKGNFYVNEANVNEMHEWKVGRIIHPIPL